MNTAVAEMDGMTQQNAAMVEQTRAAARSLASEADGMTRQIASFRIGSMTAPPAPKPAPAEPAPRRAAAPRARVVGNTALAIDEDDWSSF